MLANRLTALGDREVLLLEAGPDYPPEVELPADLVDSTRNSLFAHDWGYAHRPTGHAPLFPLPRGRVVGGSSAVNTCIALRGQPEDYDEWAAMGLAGWGFEDCLPAFRRVEHDLDFADDNHGADGPLPVRRHPRDELEPFQLAFLEACEELGLPACPDSNAPGKTGFGPHAMNKVDGRRVSAAEAYLTRDVRARMNLNIRSEVLVRRVLFDNKRVCGVEIEGPAGAERIDASRVILCAGAINTPGILLRSGVGPDHDVRHIGVEPVIDAPAVGRRLLDHPGTGVFIWAPPGMKVDRKAPMIQTVHRYSSGACNHRADMLVQPLSFSMILPRLPLFALVTQVGKPRGYGLIRYRDADPRRRPRVDSHFFEDPQDRRLAAQALRFCGALMQTRALRAFGRPVLPWNRLLRGDRWLERAVTFLCDSGYHPCGTVPMGVRPGPDAAVDGRGAMFGLEGLHVIDASVMPTIPSSNIHLPTLMIAERMAEWL